MWAVFGWYNLPASDTVFIGLAAAAVIGVAGAMSVSYTHLRAHETVLDLVCRLLLEKKKNNKVR